jgi:2-oxo-4-hydroxy-4-carboxy-5-ureidoimidazoline decarboxylase
LAVLSLRRSDRRPDAVVVPERAPALGDNLSSPQVAGSQKECRVEVPDGFGLQWLNTAPEEQAQEALLACCASRAWAQQLVAGRPYADEAAVLTAADAALAELSDADLGDALAGHPRIGARVDHPGGEWSRQEQSGMDSASERTAQEMTDGNRAYETRFGHVYLVSAAGRSAQEMLDFLRERLGNDAGTERGIVRTELAKINRNRLARLLQAQDAGVTP